MRARIVTILLAAILASSCQTILESVTAPGEPTQPPPERRVTGEPLPESLSASWKKSSIDTVSDADYLGERDGQVIVEINMLRTDPAEYARRFLLPLRAFFHGRLLQYPGETAISTNEGAPALEECIAELLAAKPRAALKPRKGLAFAARDHARDQAKSGATGHEGSDGSSLDGRIRRYGKWGVSAGENIDYGYAEPRRIVTSLIIDDGVPSRGHRKNLMDATFLFVGAATGSHPRYRYMCVLDFAGSYE